MNRQQIPTGPWGAAGAASLTARLCGALLLLALAVPADAKTSRGGGSDAPPAASFELPTSTGTVTLDGLRSKVVLVDFWASWCGPCRQSFPWLSTMSERYGDKGLVVVAINLDKDRDQAQAFMRQFTPPFIVAFDPQGKTAEAFKVNAMPSSFLVSRSGRLVYSHAGFALRDTGAIEKQIQEQIKEESAK